MEDGEFLRQFEQCTLPFEHWTHRAHVKLAFLYLRRMPLEQAIDRARDGIRRYNAAHRVPEGPGRGYSETVTCAFMRIVDATMRAYGGTFPVETADEFCDTHPHLLHRSVLRLFYSPRGRRDLDAEKHRFVEPDMCPLPRYDPADPADHDGP